MVNLGYAIVTPREMFNVGYLGEPLRNGNKFNLYTKRIKKTVKKNDKNIQRHRFVFNRVNCFIFICGE